MQSLYLFFSLSRTNSTCNVGQLKIRCQAANNNSNAAANPYLAISKLRARAVQEAPGKQGGSDVMESRAERLMRMQMELLNQVSRHEACFQILGMGM